MPADMAAIRERSASMYDGQLAIVGLAMRFPGAADEQTFWQFLLDGRDTITEIPADRWNVDKLYDPAGTGLNTSISRWGGFLDDVAAFDAKRFGIAAAEAEFLDPQQRILIELTDEVISTSHVEVQGTRTGVFVGAGRPDYYELAISQLMAGRALPPTSAIGTMPNMMAARLAHQFDLKGPAFVIDTACSSSLAALHQARLSLAAGDCDLAIVGGASLNLTATTYVALSRAGVLSPTGQCRTFDASANGVVLSEGAAVLLLQRLDEALQDARPIWGIVRGSAINNDGRTLAPMVPGLAGQKDVILRAMKAAQVTVEQVSYVETHGTSTIIGDAVETRALAQVFGTSDSPGVLIGSVKSNIGHMLGAAALPGLIKVLLALRQGVLPPSIHCCRPNPRLALDNTPLSIATRRSDWEVNGPRIAGISSFGFGGTNVHAIVEEPPRRLAAAIGRAPELDRDRPTYWLFADPQWATTCLHRDFPSKVSTHVDYQTMIHKPVWGPAAGQKDARGGLIPRHWLLAGEAKDECAGVASALRSNGIRCEMINSPDDVGRMVNAMPVQDGSTGLIYIQPEASDVDRDGEASVRGVLDVHGYLRAVACDRSNDTRKRIERILVVTRGAADMEQSCRVDSTSAAIAGFVRAAADEKLCPVVRVLDVACGTDTETMAHCVSDEARHADSHLLIAMRNHERMCLALRHADCDRPSTSPQPCQLHSGFGCCVFVGGAGAIGVKLARILFDFNANLVLVGRRPKSQIGSVIEELTADNRPVDYLSCDITDPTSCNSLIRRCVERYGQVTCLIQAAGIVDFDLIGRISEERIRRVLEVKIKGTENLHRALESNGQRPGLIALFSSLSSRLDGIGGGLAGYVAANAWMDAYAVTQRSRGWSYRVFNWGNFAEVGMAAYPWLRDRLEERGVRGLTNECARSLFQIALRRQETHLVLADLSPGATTGAKQGSEDNAILVAPKTSPMPPRGSAGNGADVVDAQPAATGNAIEAALQERIAGKLGVHPGEVEPDKHFIELGLDSLAAVDLVYALSDATQLQLPVSLFFEYPTVRDLARYLSESGRLGPANDALNISAKPHRSADPESDALSEVREKDLAVIGMTPSQLAFGKAATLYPGLPCFVALRHEFTGYVAPDVASRAMSIMSSRHELLRCSLARSSPLGEFDCFSIWPDAACNVESIDADGAVRTAEDEFCNRNRRPDEAPLMRIGISRDEALRRSRLLFVLHHSIADGWSVRNLFEEFWHTYESLAEGRCPNLRRVHTTFAESVRRTVCPENAHHLEWWQKRLSEQRGAGRDRQYSDLRQGDTFGVITRSLDAHQSIVLRRAADEITQSTFTVLLGAAVWSIGQWTCEPTTSIRVAHAGRRGGKRGLARTVGCFADTVPLYTDVDGSCEDAVRSAHDTWMEIRRRLGVSSLSVSRMPGGEVMRTPFSFSYLPLSWKPPAAVQTLDGAVRAGTAATGVDINVWRFGDEFRISLSYAPRHFDHESVERLADEFVNTVTGMARRTNAVQGQVMRTNATSGSRSEDDTRETRCRRSLLDRFNRGTHIESANRTLHERITAVASRQPDAVAIRFGDDSLSYRELDERADAFAYRLIHGGLKVETVVALCCHRSPEMVIAQLAILKAGGAYMYLAPDDPMPHRERLLSLAKAGLVVADSRNAPRFSRYPTVKIDERIGRTAGMHRPLPRLHPGNAAYICFTSGSSGTPKGVLVEHRAVTRLEAFAEGVTFDSKDVFLQHSTLAFDASVFEIFTCLMNGATLVLAPPGRLSLADLADVVLNNQITVMWMTSGLFSQMVAYEIDKLGGLQTLMAGGDALNVSQVRKVMHRWPHLRMVNGYGPTETNFTTSYIVKRADLCGGSIPIGRPLPGTQLCVLNEHGRPVAVGEIGELHVAGQGLARGYLHDPNATAAAFVRNPFTELPGKRLYRTGDRVKWRNDGVLLFCGRTDRQVKIRGFRVDPAEVERALTQLPGVGGAVVVAHRTTVDNTTRLFAFVESAIEDLATHAVEHLNRTLPSYMVPAQVFVHRRLPTNASGKIDRGKLLMHIATNEASPPRMPSPQGGESHAESTMTASERQVADAFARVLRCPIDRKDADFFAMGGDSLGVLQLFAELRKERTSLPDIDTFYEHRTVRAFADALDHHVREPAKPPVVGQLEEEFPVSATQAGFLLARLAHPHQPDAWSATVGIDGELDLTLFLRALELVVAHQPMLRASLSSESRESQKIHALVPMPLVCYDDLTHVPIDERRQRLEQYRLHSEQQQFDLCRSPLWRLTLLRTADSRHECIVTSHHMIGDAISVRLLLHDLADAYCELATDPAYKPVPLQSTFRDAVYLEKSESHIRPERRAFWQRAFATPYEPPKGWERPDPDSAEGYHRVDLGFSAAETKALRSLAVRQGVSLSSIVLTGLAAVVRRITGQSDLVVGVAHHGRSPELPGIMRVFGCFASSVPIRLMAPEVGEPEDVQRTHQAVTDALCHALSPRTLSHMLRGRITPQVAVGSQFFFTCMDFVSLKDVVPRHQEVGPHFRLSHGSTHMQLPPDLMDLHVEAGTDEGCLTICMQGAKRAFDRQRLHDCANALARDLRKSLDRDGETPGASVADAGTKGSSMAQSNSTSVTAALVGYLPPMTAIREALRSAGPLDLPVDRDGVRRHLFGNRPCTMVERVETNLGRTVFVSIPRFADELPSMNRAVLIGEIQAAIRLAGAHGARAVSLAGILPVLTSLGHDLSIENADGGRCPVITTGHACTVVSVVRQVQSCLSATSRDWKSESVALVGAGAIGLSALIFLLDELGPPASLMIFDRSGSNHRIWRSLESHCETLDGLTVRLFCRDRLDPAVYDSSLLLGASSTPGVLDVDSLRAGSILVDDSFPHCFDEARAIRRMKDAADVLITGGGLLDCGPLRRTLVIPLAQEIEKHISLAIPPFGLASCQLESLLVAKIPNLNPTVGLVKSSDARAMAQAMPRSIRAAVCHVGNFEVPGSCVAACRSTQSVH